MNINKVFNSLPEKRKLHILYLVFITTILLTLSGGFVSVEESSGGVYYVSTEGKDSNPGTKEQPLKTFEAARDAARNDGDVTHRIVILPGEYFLSKPFELDSRDNGLTIEAEKAGTVVINGGSLITGWYRDGENFWCTDLPGVKEGTWDFRALVINGRMADRSRFPDSATFIHKQVWDVKVLPAIAGYWERQPLPEERIIMAYDPKDIPASLDIRNAELRVYHMWDESMVGIKNNDLEKHVFTFSSPATYPPGAFGVRKYVIFNTREGMTRPGQWYLDRKAGKAVYWPLKDENMENARAIAPRMDQIFHISGTREKNVEKITIRGLSFQVTTIPLKSAGWGGGSFNGAVNIEFANQCILENLEIFNVGGTGISSLQIANCRIVDCTIHHTGGCGFKFNGSDALISGNHIHDIGVSFPSSAALYATGERMHIYRNEIFNGPYSGMILFGSDNLIEENNISRVMQELHDGAAIYSSGTTVKRSILRGNIVRDIVQSGQGFGVSSYYFDEGASNCIVERNLSIGVGRPTHNHIASNITYRDNVFISDGNMSLSFQRSADCVFERNTLIASGTISVVQPNAIKKWKDNIVYRNGKLKDKVLQSFTIDSTMPPFAIPARMTQPAKAVRVDKPPVLDGNMVQGEWPGEFFTLNREPSRLAASGAPVMVKFSYDKKFIYIGANITMFDPANISKGSTWGKNDGLEIAIAGKTSNGKQANFVLRIYPDGTLQSLTIAGAPVELANRLGKELRFITMINQKQRGGKGWSCEMAIPFNILGIKPAPGVKVAFNMSAYCNEYGKWHCWEGTQSDSWNLDQAGTLQLE